MPRNANAYAPALVRKSATLTPKGTRPLDGHTRQPKPGRGRPAKGYDPVAKEWTRGLAP